MKHFSTLVAAALFAISFALPASATIIYDFVGECQIDCARFGIADGTAFNETGALGLADSVDTSAGSTFALGDIEFLDLFGLNFLSGNFLVGGFASFVGGDMIGELILIGGNNAFCLDFTGSNCESGQFDTIVSGVGLEAAGGAGHGPATFVRAVPEPGTLGLLGIGLIGLGVARRNGV